MLISAKDRLIFSQSNGISLHHLLLHITLIWSFETPDFDLMHNAKISRAIFASAAFFCYVLALRKGSMGKAKQ